MKRVSDLFGYTIAWVWVASPSFKEHLNFKNLKILIRTSRLSMVIKKSFTSI